MYIHVFLSILILINAKNIPMNIPHSALVQLQSDKTGKKTKF